MNFLYIFDLVGTFAFAISGAMLGSNKKMDIYGMFVLALVTGVGGGTIRDIILGVTPPFVFKDFNYILVILVATFIVFFSYRFVEERKELLTIFDAIGLGVFTCIGITVSEAQSIALGIELSAYSFILFGVMTATVGGMLRDILAGDVPFVLQREVYASASIFGGILFVVLEYLGMNLNINILLTSLAIIFVRLISVYRNWNLPTSYRKGD